MRELSSAESVVALMAGVVAGLAAAAFHFLATEPLSIVPSRSKRCVARPKAPTKSRWSVATCSTLACFVGFRAVRPDLVAAVRSRVSTWRSVGCRRGTCPSAGCSSPRAGLWSVALFPFLKYPANPPGVGDAETISFRQALYLGILALSILGTLWPRRSLAGAKSAGVLRRVLAVYAWRCIVAPRQPGRDSNPGQIMLRTFRVLSSLGLAVFWAVSRAGVRVAAPGRARQVSSRSRRCTSPAGRSVAPDTFEQWAALQASGRPTRATGWTKRRISRSGSASPQL